MRTREDWGGVFAAIGAYVIMSDLLDTPSQWVLGLVWLLIGALLMFWPEGKG